MYKPISMPVESKVRIFEETGYGEHIQPILFFPSTCCAMGMLSAKDYHTYEEVKKCVDFLIKDSDKEYHNPGERNWGEKTIQCIISPGEKSLEKSLRKIGFQLVSSGLKRRKGYPEGQLKLYLLSF